MAHPTILLLEDTAVKLIHSHPLNTSTNSGYTIRIVKRCRSQITSNLCASFTYTYTIHFDVYATATATVSITRPYTDAYFFIPL